MNALTASHHAGPNNTVIRMIDAFRTRMRDLIALAGAPYVNGPMPPL